MELRAAIQQHLDSFRVVTDILNECIPTPTVRPGESIDTIMHQAGRRDVVDTLLSLLTEVESDVLSTQHTLPSSSRRAS